MAAVSFKGVGRKASEVKKNFRSRSTPPVGIRTPLTLVEGVGSIFLMHYAPKDQIRDNLKNLLTTNHGERLGRYDYGANLRPLLFDMVDRADFEVEAMQRIRESVSTYMNMVELSSFEILGYDQNGKGISRTKLKVTYNIPKILISNETLTVNIDAGG